MPFIFHIAVTLLLCAALYTDLAQGLIPNQVIVGFVLAGLGVHLWTRLGGNCYGPWDCAQAIGNGATTWLNGLVIGGLLLLIPYVQRGVGEGI